MRQAEALARRLASGPQEAPKRKEKDADTRRLETELSDKLGSKVEINYKPRAGGGGRGEIVIRYTGIEELEGILAHLRR